MVSQMSEKNFNHYLKTVIDYTVDIRSRTIYLVGEIDQTTVLPTVQYLNLLSSPKCFKNYLDPINLVISSEGGADDMNLFLYDSIQSCAAPVHTIGSGMVCSAATLILSCGEKRFGTENLWLMAHKGSVTLSGDDDSVVSQAVLQSKVSDRYWKLLARHTTKTALQWYRKARNSGELWLNANQLIEWGVIDEIIPTRRVFEPISNRLIKDLLNEDQEED